MRCDHVRGGRGCCASTVRACVHWRGARSLSGIAGNDMNPFGSQEETQNLAGSTNNSSLGSDDTSDMYSISSPRSSVQTDDPGVSFIRNRAMGAEDGLCISAMALHAPQSLRAKRRFCVLTQWVSDSKDEDVPCLCGGCWARAQCWNGLQVLAASHSLPPRNEPHCVICPAQYSLQLERLLSPLLDHW